MRRLMYLHVYICVGRHLGLACYIVADVLSGKRVFVSDCLLPCFSSLFFSSLLSSVWVYCIHVCTHVHVYTRMIQSQKACILLCCITLYYGMVHARIHFKQ